ncbi:zinc dependent phospholipase C family protein [Virgibacillus alimentarius]|uniref:Phospholipase C/D domain-containing protein n=1 Tax=Virgibacillus alimentarius TaxID=698769 RepID=A0ABS4SA08_9BACI|nr:MULTISPECIES: zinc dependent phospholipase C family protein [Virgibacillus]MBP2257840.1 hypothetical protein [Virgibacillus alimentarius]HLR66564.1 zinc dependent phospholipase C family protein [Virgibacillus sp.]
MPKIWTHILFCEDILDTIIGPHPFSQNETFIKLGAQGPDLFLYYNFWPWSTNKEHIHAISNFLHTERCGNFIVDLIKAAKDKNEKVRSYVFGFITHHLLDRNTHPYIYHLAQALHHEPQELEVKIDTLMMERFHRLKTWKAPAYKEIDIGFRMNKDIASLLHDLIKKYNQKIRGQNAAYIHKSYRDMKLALRLFSDPYGWKNKLFPSYVSLYSHQPVNDHIDYLNLQKTTWYHPVTKKPSLESFIDLYENARAEGLEIITEVLNYWHSENAFVPKKLLQLIGNKSYQTGMSLPKK